MSKTTVVQIRVEVVHIESFTVDLQVPTYTPAREITRCAAQRQICATLQNGISLITMALSERDLS